MWRKLKSSQDIHTVLMLSGSNVLHSGSFFLHLFWTLFFRFLKDYSMSLPDQLFDYSSFCGALYQINGLHLFLAVSNSSNLITGKLFFRFHFFLPCVIFVGFTCMIMH